ncbi:hypothetical protein WN51_13641 [Melipona quadrifasciata]|uniref:Uncharacterized protein n=1 Tax=Melipona quadrifasciata TaxID=166423 RepID=A0A0M9A0E8_9HYME|nr:hypothetical protein WN51_13641 [Melipona quadrifasciata]
MHTNTQQYSKYPKAGQCRKARTRFDLDSLEMVIPDVDDRKRGGAPMKIQTDESPQTIAATEPRNWSRIGSFTGKGSRPMKLILDNAGLHVATSIKKTFQDTNACKYLFLHLIQSRKIDKNPAKRCSPFDLADESLQVVLAAHARTNYLSLAVEGKESEGKRKRKEMTPSLECREPLVIVLPGRLLSWKSSAGWPKDGEYSISIDRLFYTDGDLTLTKNLPQQGYRQHPKLNTRHKKPQKVKCSLKAVLQAFLPTSRKGEELEEGVIMECILALFNSHATTVMNEMLLIQCQGQGQFCNSLHSQFYRDRHKYKPDNAVLFVQDFIEYYNSPRLRAPETSFPLIHPISSTQWRQSDGTSSVSSVVKGIIVNRNYSKKRSTKVYLPQNLDNGPLSSLLSWEVTLLDTMF